MGRVSTHSREPSRPVSNRASGVIATMIVTVGTDVDVWANEDELSVVGSLDHEQPEVSPQFGHL
jgi:hypothetical protein